MRDERPVLAVAGEALLDRRYISAVRILRMRGELTDWDGSRLEAEAFHSGRFPAANGASA